ncbi:MAG TPA: hypothetical protein VFE62_30380 [Gemmataceae bacterium]|nr:hypothetical protein [Gemmataceae bacterium]
MSKGRTVRRQPKYVRLGIDLPLEERLTPTNVTASINGTQLTLSKPSGSVSLTIVNSGSFQQFTINTNAGNTISFGTLVGTSFTTPTVITSIVISLGTGTDSVTFDGASAGSINLTGGTTTNPTGLSISGSGGDKTITAQNLYLLNKSNLKMAMGGNGALTTSFTDVDVTGTATITHNTGSGNTSFTLTTSSNNAATVNNWGSLSISNAAGSDTNIINDTNFTGNVSITNGNGSGSTSQFAGSKNLFAANHSTGLLTVHGGITVTTGTGQSDTELNDYNVHGAVSITTGSGTSGQSVANFVGIANNQSLAAMVPTIGSTSVTGTAVGSLNPGLTVDIGTDAAGDDFPLVVQGTLGVTTNGSGSADIELNDLTVGGAATVTLASTAGNTVNVRGDQALTTFNSLAINSSATGSSTNNTFNIQTVQGNAYFTGALTFKLGTGSDNITVGASNGTVQTGGAFGLTGTGGNKTITARNDNFGSISYSFTGTVAGSLTSLYTDVNVTGAATLSHTNTGNTSFTVAVSANNTNALNNWSSLTITNGAGSDINTIQDTDFSGNVSITNGAGVAGQFGGSHNLLEANHNAGLLAVHGGLSISTTSGQSDTEVNDYNVHGAVTIGAGSGGSGFANFVGIANNQSIVSVIPTVGSVSITGTAVSGLNPGLTVDIGTDASGDDFPLVVQGTLAVSTSGTGSADIELNDLTVAGAATITLASTASNTVNVHGDQALTTFGSLAIISSATGSANNTFNIQTIDGNAYFTGALTFKLGNGSDVIKVGNSTSATSAVVTGGAFGASATTGTSLTTKTITAVNDIFGSIAISFTSTGSLSSTFTDVNVNGAATVTHSGTGSTSFTIATSSNNVNALNTWGSLAITNGAGSDINTINDTDFNGNVTIANGAGAGTTAQFAGSHTVFSADNYQGLLAVHGNVSITTTNGQSDSEIYDYNVSGSVSITTGAGILNQSAPNLAGIEDNQTVSGSGIPVIGGNVTIVGTPTKNLSPGLIINLGIDNSANNYPLVIAGNLAITTNGTGSAKITLNDLNVGTGAAGTTTATTFGATTITLGSTTSNNVVSVQGSSVTSVYWNFTLTSAAGGANSFNFQNQAGTLEMTGTTKVTLGAGNDTVALATASNSILELFGTSTFDGGAGIDQLFNGPVGTDLFYIFTPVIKNFP